MSAGIEEVEGNLFGGLTNNPYLTIASSRVATGVAKNSEGYAFLTNWLLPVLLLPFPQ